MNTRQIHDALQEQFLSQAEALAQRAKVSGLLENDLKDAGKFAEFNAGNAVDPILYIKRKASHLPRWRECSPAFIEVMEGQVWPWLKSKTDEPGIKADAMGWFLSMVHGYYVGLSIAR